MTIWKFPFTITDGFTLEIPMPAHIVHVAMQGDQPCLWAVVDPEGRKAKASFIIVGTGQEIPPLEMFKFVASFQQPPFVWHLFMMRGGPFE